ncbi:unnamed protein product, partial [Ceratitis capitata]
TYLFRFHYYYCYDNTQNRVYILSLAVLNSARMTPLHLSSSLRQYIYRFRYDNASIIFATTPPILLFRCLIFRLYPGKYACICHCHTFLGGLTTKVIQPQTLPVLHFPFSETIFHHVVKGGLSNNDPALKRIFFVSKTFLKVGY